MSAIFVHIATLHGYNNIVDNIVDNINISGLINYVDKIFLCYVGDSPTIDYNEKHGQEKYENVYLSDNLKDFEFPTLNYIRDYCKNNKDGRVLYLHTKGISTPDNLCIVDWRNYMLYFAVEKYEDCLTALELHDTCGVDLKTEPALHYSGNFWWATAKHINSLPTFEDMTTVLTERHKAEFWICSIGANHKSFWDSNIKVNERHLHRYTIDKYRPHSLLNDLAIKYGTDKQIGQHGYVRYYERFFRHIRSNKLKVLELGVREGWSLRMWHDYFENSLVCGIDNDAEGLCPKSFSEKRIVFELGSQEDEDFLNNLNEKHGPFDIIIDDASHISPLTIRSFEILFPLLKRGGLYIIEDLQASDYEHYLPYGISTKEFLTQDLSDVESKLIFNKKIAFLTKCL